MARRAARDTARVVEGLDARAHGRRDGGAAEAGVSARTAGSARESGAALAGARRDGLGHEPDYLAVRLGLG